MSSGRKRVAILGATGHVGKVVSANLAADYDLTLYARRPDVAERFVRANELLACEVAEFETLMEREHDVVVNCVGVGDPAVVRAQPELVYATTQSMDDVALAYLTQHDGARLVAISSGAAYLSNFETPADDSTPATIAAACVRPDQHYGLAKLASEARHRAWAEHSVVDVRLFSLFSRFIDTGTDYALCQALRAIETGTTLRVGADVQRDYVAPTDLTRLVAACIESGAGVNAAVDTFSVAPVGMHALFEMLAEAFGLRFELDDAVGRSVAATGAKPAYFSVSRRATELLGYEPTQASLETVRAEFEILIGGHR